MHPLSPINERQRIRDLVDGQIIRLHLYGLLWEHSVTIPEILTPHTRRSPFIGEGELAIVYRRSDIDLHIAVTSHLDTISCWKGLSYCQASELMVWYNIFNDCLTSLVEEALRDDLVEEILWDEGKFDHSAIQGLGPISVGTCFSQLNSS